MGVGHYFDLTAVSELADVSGPIQRAMHYFHRSPLVTCRRGTHLIDLLKPVKAL